MGEEEPVGEGDDDERQRGRDERQPEALHPAQQRAVELEAELLAAVAEQGRVDDERAGEVPRDDADGAPLETITKRTVAPTVIAMFARLAARNAPALLDPEHGRQLLVVHLRPEADEGGADERRVVDPEQPPDRLGQDQPRDEAGRGGGHRVPEGRAHTVRRCARGRGVEGEAEEGARDPAPEDRHEYRREGDDDADGAEVARVEVARVDREQEDGDEARDDPAEAVDRGLARELLQPCSQHD